MYLSQTDKIRAGEKATMVGWVVFLLLCFFAIKHFGFDLSNQRTAEGKKEYLSHWKQQTGTVVSAGRVQGGSTDAYRVARVRYPDWNGVVQTKTYLLDWHATQGTRETVWVNGSREALVADDLERAKELPPDHHHDYASSTVMLAIGACLLAAIIGLIIYFLVEDLIIRLMLKMPRLRSRALSSY